MGYRIYAEASLVKLIDVMVSSTHTDKVFSILSQATKIFEGFMLSCMNTSICLYPRMF